MDINTIMPAKCEKMVQEVIYGEHTRAGIQMFKYNSQDTNVIATYAVDFGATVVVYFILQSKNLRYFQQVDTHQGRIEGLEDPETSVRHLPIELAISFSIMKCSHMRMSFLEAFGFEPEDA
jgi:hypothetical protein